MYMTTGPQRSTQQDLRAAFASKLGRCARCIRLSVSLMLGSLFLLAAANSIGASSAVSFFFAIPACVFTVWSGMHGVAYVWRGPERATGCRSCAEKRAAYRRRNRWRRLKARLLGRAAPRRGHASANCTDCGHRTAPEEMSAAPPAAEDMRHVVDDSPEFQRLSPRLVSPMPADTWEANMLHYFLYDLMPDDEGRESHAVFITRWEDDAPVSAMIVTPDPAGGNPGLVDLRSDRGMPIGVLQAPRSS